MDANGEQGTYLDVGEIDAVSFRDEAAGIGKSAVHAMGACSWTGVVKSPGCVGRALAFAALLGIVAAAQARATGPVIHSGGKVITLAWGGLTWHIPERFFFGVRAWSQNGTALWIQSWWTKKDDTFSSRYTDEHAILLDIHPSKADVKNPKNGLRLIQRIHLPSAKVPIFLSAKVNGMTYLESSSNFHYFSLNHQDAYVDCWLIKAAKLKSPEVPPDVLSRKFTCETVFYFPNKTFVWVRMWGIGLNEAAPAFNAAHRLVLSFIR